MTAPLKPHRHLAWNLARLLRRQEGMVRQWARGVVAMPGDVAAWLDAVGAFHEANPPPVSA